MTQQPEDDRLPLVEEQLVVGTVPVATGRVRVSAVTDTIEEVARADLQGMSVDVTRVPVGRVIQAAPEVRVDGDVTIIPVIEERLVVQTELVLTEEIHVRRSATTESVEQPVTLRRQCAVVERTDPETGALILEQTPNPEGTDR
jgi:stress response protein YsnF